MSFLASLLLFILLNCMFIGKLFVSFWHGQLRLYSLKLRVYSFFLVANCSFLTFANVFFPKCWFVIFKMLKIYFKILKFLFRFSNFHIFLWIAQFSSWSCTFAWTFLFSRHVLPPKSRHVCKNINLLNRSYFFFSLSASCKLCKYYSEFEIASSFFLRALLRTDRSFRANWNSISSLNTKNLSVSL